MAKQQYNDVAFYKKLRNVLRKPSIRYMTPADRPSTAFQQRLHNQFLTSSRNLYQQSLAGSTERYARVRDYELMDTVSPMCSMALNIYADNATQIGDQGLVVEIKSEISKIKEELEILYYDIMAVDYNAWHWIRNTGKYGDNFLLLDVERENGITSFLQLPTVEVEREEGFDSNVNSVRFKWTYNSGAVYDNFQIAHFRIKGDDTFLPYGRAVLEPARRPWKQYNLIFDAMLSYRIARAPERRVFYVDIGNIEPSDVNDFMNRVRDQLKRQPLVDEAQGNIDYRYNAVPLDDDYFIPVRQNSGTRVDTLPGACLALDTKIKLLDGRSVELQQLIKEHEEGKKNWVYSCDPKTGKIVPGPITWAGITRKNTDVMKITLDNGESVVATPDHKFLLRNGMKTEAKDLVVGDSLMPLYTKISSDKNKNRLNGYEMIFDNKDKEWRYTHRMVAEYFKGTKLEQIKTHLIDENKKIIHHDNFNKLNNNPENLFWMGTHDHFSYHSSLSDSNKARHMVKKLWEKIRNDEDFAKMYFEKRAKTLKENWDAKSEDEKSIIFDNRIKGLNEYFDNLSEQEKEQWAIHCRENFLLGSKARIKKQRENPEWVAEVYERAGQKQSDTKKNDKEVNDKIIENNKKMWENKEYRNMMILKSSTRWNDPEYRERVSKKISEGKKKAYHNHKIIKIEYLEEKIDVGTITVDGEEKYHDYHTFALACGIEIFNSNLGDIEDVKLIRSELINSLGIPSIYVDDSELGGGRSLGAQQDLQFARTVQRVQKTFLSELTKIGIIHLIAKGYSQEQISSFTLSMTPPSAILEMQKLEVFDKRFQIYSSAIRDKGVSKRWAQKYILNLSNEEIQLIDKELESDSKLANRLTTIENAQPGEAAGMMPGAGATPESPATDLTSPGGPEAPTLTDASIINDMVDDSKISDFIQKKLKKDYLTKSLSESLKNDKDMKDIVKNLKNKLNEIKEEKKNEPQ